MAADTSVKFSNNGSTGAPVLNGTAGSLIAVLDAVLVNGFNLLTADSVVVSGGVATVTRAAGGFQTHIGTEGSYEGLVMTIAGATPAGLNGEKRILRVGTTGTTSFTFDATGVADGAATGTITFKRAPLGWNKVYAGTNVAIYQRTDVNATSSVMYVTDTFGKYASIGMYEVSDQSLLATGGGIKNGVSCQWTKSNVADAAARSWMVIGDGRGIFMGRGWHNGDGNGFEHTYWGDCSPTKANDPYSCVTLGISGDASGQTGGPGYGANLNNNNSIDESMAGSLASVHPYDYRGTWYMQRSYSGLGGPVQLKRNAVSIAPFQVSLGQSINYPLSGLSGWGTTGAAVINFAAQVFNTTVPFPNPSDNGVFGVPVVLWEHLSPAIRGTIPGFFYLPMSTLQQTFTQYGTTAGTGQFAGRMLLQVTSKVNLTTSGAPTNSNGGVLYDVTGPWVR